MQIGLETKTTIPLQVPILPILVIIQFLSHLRNNIQLLGHPQRPSIDQLPLLLQKSIGFVPFSQSLASLYLHHLLSIVIMLVPPISVLIQSFIQHETCGNRLSIYSRSSSIRCSSCYSCFFRRSTCRHSY